MGSGNLYVRPANTIKNVKGNRLVRSLLFAGMLLITMPFAGKASPTFVNGPTQTISTCENSGFPSSTLASVLNIVDSTNIVGTPETWYVVSGPSFGSVEGFPYSFPSDGGVLTTAGSTIAYMPNPGFSGSDIITVADSDAYGNVTTTMITIVVTPLPSLVIGSVPAVCAGATSTTISYSDLANVGPTSSTFYRLPSGSGTGPFAGGGGIDSFVVPPGVDTVTFDVQGAAGGGDSHSGAPNPGNGGRVQGAMAVTPGEVLYIYTGGQGNNGQNPEAYGGFNGGGNAYYYFFGCGGAGGGASDIRANNQSLTSRVVVAGGGGGNGWDSPGPLAGGNGGDSIGGSSANNVGGSHSGGGNNILLSGGAHATYTGWTPGGNGSFGVGGDGSVQGLSGGGGGGYFGGGGGIWTGGGGGSSFASPGVVPAPVFTQGYNIGAGIVALDYNIPGTYDILWGSEATAAGFASVSGAVLPSSPITVALPPTAPPSTVGSPYTGTLRIHNGTCMSSDIPFTVIINPIPDVDTVANQVLCNGASTADIIYTGSVPGTTFNWTNDQPTIGISTPGSGDILSFVASNPGASPLTANITVTPVANGCTGTSYTSTITINPLPSLTTSLAPAGICDSTELNYAPTSGTAGTSFTWFRYPVAGISNPYASGSGNPNSSMYEYLDNTTPNTIVVPYTYQLAANGCIDSQVVNVAVYPQPTLSSTLTPPSICDNTVFNYTPLSATPSTIFSWTRNTTTGISNVASLGTNNPGETLHNTTVDSVTVPYQFTLTANGCSNTQAVAVTVYPNPVLSSASTIAAICDSGAVSYMGTTLTPGATLAWYRPNVIGISTPSATDDTSGTISENLVNVTADPILVAYQFTISGYNGCNNTQNVLVTVNPMPRLSSSLTPSVCDSTVFNYTPTSVTTGTSFSWSRDTVTGISNGPGSGINNPGETLVNTTTYPVIATYVYTMLANSCPSVESVSLTVNPRPKLSSTLTPPAICDSMNFNYPVASNTAGAAFSWYRPYIPGIYAVAETGIGNPNQQLINSTYVVVDVTYNFTITANGCSNMENVVVAVNPTPKLNPPYTATVCSGSPFNYTPTSYTPGALYAWNRPAVAHIGPTSSFSGIGTGVIDETLTDSLLAPELVEYIYRLTVNGCTNTSTQTLRLTVNPAPEVPAIITYPPSNLCDQTMFQNFGAGPTQASGIDYHWSAQNATIYAEGSNNQNILVNFNSPGTAVISINSNVSGYDGCLTSNSYTVNVGTSVSENPAVIYYNGQFICLKTDNSTYQWGYDNATTLDSTLIPGQIDQTYSNSSPDFTDNHYWCITTKDGCMQKSYYNAPTGIANVDAGNVTINVYPNPASDVLNVEINSSVIGNLDVEVLNMLGQKLDMQPVNNHKTSINVANLPSGAYLVDCYRDGIKIATTRFIKN